MGQFSWFTNDKNERIVVGDTSDIYMTGKDGRLFYLEGEYYEGYGVFGGKDFYEYLAELNGKGSDRVEGIKIAFSGKDYESPKLFSDAINITKAHKYGSPKIDPDQGFGDAELFLGCCDNWEDEEYNN